MIHLKWILLILINQVLRRMLRGILLLTYRRQFATIAVIVQNGICTNNKLGVEKICVEL